jgi:8-oxo-dGTP diphosphatase
MDRLHRRGIVILTALDLEYEAVRAHLVAPERQPHPGGTLFEVGQLRDAPCRFAIARTGHGNAPSALIAERAIGMFQPKALFFVGIAGALRDDVRLGDVVVATKVYAFHGGRDEMTGFQARPEAWTAPHELEQIAGHVARTRAWRACTDTGKRPADVHLKPIAAGEVVVDSHAGSVADHIRRHYNDAVAVDMESVGIAWAAHLNRSLPILSIRGISDRADGSKSFLDRTSRWRAIAAANAAAFAVAIATHVTSFGPPHRDAA